MGPAFMNVAWLDMGAAGVSTVVVDEELVGIVAVRAAYTRSVIWGLDNLRIAANDVVLAVEQAQKE